MFLSLLFIILVTGTTFFCSLSHQMTSDPSLLIRSVSHHCTFCHSSHSAAVFLNLPFHPSPSPVTSHGLWFSLLVSLLAFALPPSISCHAPNAPKWVLLKHHFSRYIFLLRYFHGLLVPEDEGQVTLAFRLTPVGLIVCLCALCPLSLPHPAAIVRSSCLFPSVSLALTVPTPASTSGILSEIL